MRQTHRPRPEAGRSGRPRPHHDRVHIRPAPRSSSPPASPWWPCSARATSSSGSSRRPSRPPTSTCGATRSPSPGEPGEVALVERLFDELITVLRTGQGVTAEAVERMVAMLRTETGERPAEVLTLNILSNRGRTIRPKTLNQKRYVDAIDQHTIVFGIGPAGTGKTYLAMAKARAGAAGQAGQPDHPDPPGGRGGGAARLPARHAVREDRPVPAAALRRAARHDRPRVDPAADDRRHDRGRAARIHAGPHASTTRSSSWTRRRTPRRSR